MPMLDLRHVEDAGPAVLESAVTAETRDEDVPAVAEALRARITRTREPRGAGPRCRAPSQPLRFRPRPSPRPAGDRRERGWPAATAASATPCCGVSPRGTTTPTPTGPSGSWSACPTPRSGLSSGRPPPAGTRPLTAWTPRSGHCCWPGTHRLSLAQTTAMTRTARRPGAGAGPAGRRRGPPRAHPAEVMCRVRVAVTAPRAPLAGRPDRDRRRRRRPRPRPGQVRGGPVRAAVLHPPAVLGRVRPGLRPEDHRGGPGPAP